MKRIRINNDFTFAWAIERNGLPEDLSTAINMRLRARNSTGAIQVITDYEVASNMVSVEITPEIANVLGRYVFILTYELPDAGLSDLERLCEVDTDAFIIVPRTAEADDAEDFLVTSDMAIGFKGDSAYQVWLEAGNVGTEADYLASLKGDSFLYSDFTPEQLEALKVKGDKGDPFLYEDFTPEQIEALKVKGDKGDSFEYADFTPEQIVTLQQPATDAAGTLTTAVNAKLGEADTAIQNAENATTWANNAASLANTKAGLANEKALLANEKAGLAASATTKANEAMDGANSAAQSATNLVNSYATDLAAKELKANKKTTLTDSDTDYPTTKAVNAGLAGKADTNHTHDDLLSIIYAGL